MNLQDKIKNRDTELQRAYDSYMTEKFETIIQIENLHNAQKMAEKKLDEIYVNLRKCHDRAIELDCLSIL